MAYQIKNVIFDFGNVLLNINMDQFRLHLSQQIGASSAAQLIQKLEQRNVFKLYETGGITSTEFIDYFLHFEQTGALKPEDIVRCWNAIFIGMPPHRFQMLLDLRKRYKVFLLSNINDLHLTWITNYMKNTHQITDFEVRHFDAVYYSHLVRMRKPNAEIYEYVLMDADLRAHETVFFDDLPDNIAAARALGIQAQWHDPDRDILEHVQSLHLL